MYNDMIAIQAAAVRLGAPFGDDLCTIHLSDQSTPWNIIKRRVQAAAWGDFVVGFYNPSSRKHEDRLTCAIEILRSERRPDTPVLIAQNVTRPDESTTITTLEEFDPTVLDIVTLVIVGNTQTDQFGSRVVSQRGSLQNDPSQEEARQRFAKIEPKSYRDQPHGFSHKQQTQPKFQHRIYPIALTGLQDARVLVVGGGPVGERKVKNLLTVGAHVTLVSPRATPLLQKWAASGQIRWLSRSYQTNDCIGVRLVYAATNQRMVNAQIARDAAQLDLLCNVADAPHEGNFHLPAVYRQDNVVVAVSTEQAQPKHAIKIRDAISKWLK
ncbi:hypothetical protein KFU94_48930 [Chloroflexi bacterium TSY]|nr:hypothetical protein [Chloroflexi bacterium TSY]